MMFVGLPGTLKPVYASRALLCRISAQRAAPVRPTQHDPNAQYGVAQPPTTNVRRLNRPHVIGITAYHSRRTGSAAASASRHQLGETRPDPSEFQTYIDGH
jgi:hypothetical protein